MENEQIVIELKELLYEVMMQPKASRELLAAWPGLKNKLPKRIKSCSRSRL